ncbi:GNAT family N-acetyltransferase [Telluribacter humicola]|uniref:GNAT family N-acetyltransferase n=1 Tax=Telluribacter humicola TaxID=1720261 RepID=UPI001A96B2FE|nr:GNAT family N-acetyltransferase [Telluribacter humicola]
MIAATDQDKKLVVDILSSAFNENQSVNYLIPQDGNRFKRIRALMDYSYEVCKTAGKVVLSDDRKACALVLFPDQKKTTLTSLVPMVRLIKNAIGVGNIGKAMNRESLIAKHHPQTPFYHLWFIGVQPEYKGTGIGGRLLRELMEEAKGMNRPVFLETSTMKNLPWYKKHGFSIYHNLELSYTLYLLRKTF